MTTYLAHPIDPSTLKELRTADDAGRRPRPLTDEEGGAPLRCCLRRSTPGERIALVSYAPLRRWAAENGVDPGAYDEQGPVFVHAEECAGPFDGALRKALDDPSVAFVHVRAVEYGCFLYEVRRA